MQALKGLVVGLGILIIFGFILLIYGFYTKMTDPEFKVLKDPNAPVAAAPSSSPPSGAAPVALPEAAAATPEAPFGDIRVALPAGCRVAEMRPDGNRMYLRLGPDGDCARIVVIEPSQGRVLGTILLTP